MERYERKAWQQTGKKNIFATLNVQNFDSALSILALFVTRIQIYICNFA